MNKAFTERNIRRCTSPNGFNHALSDWSASDWMVAIIGEIGEAANIIKKLNRLRDKIPGNKESFVELRDKLMDEIADTYIYLDLFCVAEGIDLEKAVMNKFNKKSKEIGYVE